MRPVLILALLIGLPLGVAQAQDPTDPDAYAYWFDHYQFVLSAKILSVRDTSIAFGTDSYRATRFVVRPLTQWKGHLADTVTFVKIVGGHAWYPLPRKRGAVVVLYLDPRDALLIAGDRSRPISRARDDTTYASAHRTN